VEFETFLETVGRRTHVEGDRTAVVARATLESLGERLSRGEGRHLAKQLPLELSAWILNGHPGQPFDLDEFLRRVSQGEGVDMETAEIHARMVLATVRQAISEEGIAHLLADLPDEFRPLVLNLDVTPAEDLVARVAARTGLDHDAASRALEAVLENLASRIPEGQVKDLRSWLPVALHPALQRGRAARALGTRRLSAEGLVHRVAAGEATTPDAARGHIRAVLAILRDAVPTEEFLDLVVELPPDYADLLPEPEHHG
jgi:uncharacterized protein (DUF2267 family)